jgi:hypothetical protein
VKFGLKILQGFSHPFPKELSFKYTHNLPYLLKANLKLMKVKHKTDLGTIHVVTRSNFHKTDATPTKTFSVIF